MLTKRQQAFVNEYLTCRVGSKAAILAGYSKKTAYQIAYENLRKPEIISALTEKQADLSKQYELNKDSVIHELLSAVEVAKEKLDAGNMIRAWCEVAKLLGFYEPVAKREVTLVESEVLRTKFEAMSDEELLKIVNVNTPK